MDIRIPAALLVVASLVGAATACTSAAPKKSTICDKESDECADDEDDDSSSREDDSTSRSKRSGGPSGPTEPVDDEKPAPGTDAGTGDPTPPTDPKLGAFCTALKACCEALRDKGITGSANQCDSVVAGKSEFGCSLAHDDYATPGDEYDPPAACQK